MKNRMRNYEEIREALLRDGDATERDLEVLFEALYEYYYNGIQFSISGNPKALIGYNQMNAIKRENASLALQGKGSVMLNTTDASVYKKDEVQLKHRIEMIASAKKWMKGKMAFTYNSFETLTFHLDSYKYTADTKAKGIDLKYEYDSPYSNKKSIEYNELLLFDLDGHRVQHAEDSRLWSMVSDLIGDDLQFGNRKIATLQEIYDYLDSLTVEEIATNTINKEIRVRGKRYGKGAKLTRVLTILQDNDLIKNKTADEFNLQETTDEIFLTSNILGAAAAGIISDSCFSPHGSNSYANIHSMNYKEVIWAFSKNLDWRTIITIDNDSKKATIHNGYPMNKIQNIRVIQYYLESVGYEIVNSYYFDYDDIEYWSYDSPIIADNQHSQYTLFADKSPKETLVKAEENVLLPAYDIGDGSLTIWHEDEESFEYCDCCNEYHQNTVYINDNSYCSYCAMNLIETNTRHILENTRNLVIRDRLEEMTMESTLEDIKHEIEDITDYVADNMYAILGRVYFYDYDLNQYRFKATSGNLDHFTETSADYLHSSYQCDMLEDDAYLLNFTPEVQEQLRDYFTYEYDDMKYHDYLSNTDIMNTVDDLVDYILN